MNHVICYDFFNSVISVLFLSAKYVFLGWKEVTRHQDDVVLCGKENLRSSCNAWTNNYLSEVVT